MAGTMRVVADPMRLVLGRGEGQGIREDSGSGGQGGSRERIIAKAGQEYDRASPVDQAICSRSAWVNDSLREAGELPMTEAESTPTGCSPVVRAALILAASGEFDRAGKFARSVCSRAAWVNDSLRAIGEPGLTGDELINTG